MKIWILGSNWLLGSALVKMCQERQLHYVATNKSAVDIASFESLKNFAYAEKPAYIINCAAYTNVDKAEEEKEIAHRVNALGPGFLGLIAKMIHAHVVHISTDYVFSGEENLPYPETARADPQSVYGMTKWEGECRLLDELPSACILRTSWLFGLNGKNFLSSCLTCLKEKKQLRIVSDQVGRLTFFKDLSNAIFHLLPYQGVFHFANEGTASRFDMVQELLREMQSRGIGTECKEIIPVSSEEFPMRAKRPRYSVLDTRKWENLFGHKPRHWKETVKEFLDEIT
jgi:dTDP-4-dehydrorhamnose reductase